MAPLPRIRDAERITLWVPFTPRCAHWNAREIFNWQVVELIRLTTDRPGLVGYGETLPHYTWGRVSDAALARVRGADPITLLGDDSLGAGLQMAVYDLVGQALEVPLHRLLGLPQVREWCPISWWNIDMPADALAAEASAALAAGYTAYKIKARPWWDVYAQVEAISAVTPPTFQLDLDWNTMLIHAGHAAAVLAALDAYPRVAIYESPIVQHDVAGQRLLRQKTTRPIALHFGDPPFPTAMRHDVCDGFVVSGGVATVMRQAALAAAFEKAFWLQLVGTGLTTAFSAHLGAVLSHARWPAVSCLNNYSDDLLCEPLTIRHGLVRVPDGPGLGVRIDEDALGRLRMAPPYAATPPRQLMTVRWAHGRTVHYTSMRPQCWDDHFAGNHPVQERGVTMTLHDDDGSPEWAERYARASLRPLVEYA